MGNSVVTEATVSGGHATLRWQSGSWVLDDLGSTNGSYADHSYDRQIAATIMHGGEAQIGELRLKLVASSPTARTTAAPATPRPRRNRPAHPRAVLK